MESKLRTVTWEELKKHATSNSWVIIDDSVYNVSDYMVEHPGGDDILIE